MTSIIFSLNNEKLTMVDSVGKDNLMSVNIYLFFYLYIYLPDPQESDGGANTLGKQLPASGDAKVLLSLVILFYFFYLIVCIRHQGP